MAWLYVPGSEGLSSDSISPSDRRRSSAGSSTTQKKRECSRHECRTGSSRTRPYGTTSAPSTVASGEGSTSSPLAGPAAHSRRQAEAELQRPTSGGRCGKSSLSRGLGSSRLRTYLAHHGPAWGTPWNDSATAWRIVSLALARSALPTADRAATFWPTPTAKANHDAPSMQKWPAYRRWQTEVQGTTPEVWEYLMGWPRGWTDYEPAATEWSRWRRRMRSELWRLEQGL
jgi:hypothetical protein